MQQKYRNSVAFDERTYIRLAALAEANFTTPKRGGNAAAVLRHLINQAWADPQKFGLLPPAAGAGDTGAGDTGGEDTGGEDAGDEETPQARRTDR